LAVIQRSAFRDEGSLFDCVYFATARSAEADAPLRRPFTLRYFAKCQPGELLFLGIDAARRRFYEAEPRLRVRSTNSDSLPRNLAQIEYRPVSILGTPEKLDGWSRCQEGLHAGSQDDLCKAIVP
jgi:hypothetical protein